TWHFVAPQDIRWLLALTSARVHAANAAMYRKLELSAPLLARCHTALSQALMGGRHLTRTQLGQCLNESGIVASGQRLAYILMHAELEALICSGQRREKQFTYALLSERVPQANTLDRDASLAELALRYFRSHGPAQAKDFAWWSGLTLKEANIGIHSVQSQLAEISLDGKTYWFSPRMQESKQPGPRAFLLSIYDEYTIAYKDRSAIAEKKYLEKLLSMGNALTSVLLLDGKVVGTWKRVLKKGGIDLTLNLEKPISQSEREAIEREATRYSHFHQMPVTPVFELVMKD
ncbi:MAG: winged helix DNA-binding domain-containing protein, partial [Chloroflexi bacterium]